MPLFAVRWLNDSFTLLTAESASEALSSLNDVCDTSQCELFGPLDYDNKMRQSSLFLDFKKLNDPLLDIAELDIWKESIRKRDELMTIRRYFQWERRDEWMHAKVRDWVKIEIAHTAGSSTTTTTFKLDKTLYMMLAKRPETEFNETIRVQSTTEGKISMESLMAILMKDAAVKEDGTVEVGHGQAQSSITATTQPQENNVYDRSSRRSGRVYDPKLLDSGATQEMPAKRRRLQEDTHTKYKRLVQTYEDAFALAQSVFNESELCSNIHQFLMEDIKRYCDDFTLVSRKHSSSTENEGSEVRHFVYEENWTHMMEFLEVLEEQKSGLANWLFWNAFQLKEQARIFAPQTDLNRFDSVTDETKRYVLSHDDNEGLPTFSLEADYSDPPLVSHVIFARRKDLFDADDSVKKQVLVKDKVLFRTLVEEQRRKASEEVRGASAIDSSNMPDDVGEEEG